MGFSPRLSRPPRGRGRPVARCSNIHARLQLHSDAPPGFLADAGGMSTVTGGGPVLDWAALVPRTVHPVKVSIIEAMEWIGEPVSATELTEMFEEPEGHYLSLISY